jgi:NAD(P)-dependent dehydrogenase (short-subunit alcohol dehydrogenase family)
MEATMRLHNKSVVVTGAGSSLGRAITALFADEGANVLAVAMGTKRLEQLAGAREYAGTIIPRVGDMLVKADIEGMIDDAVARFGRLDVLVNNAGLMDDFSPVGEFNDALFDKVMKLNLEAPAYAMRRAIKEFQKEGGGVIINIASVSGLFGSRGGAAYTASKHGLIGLTKNTAFMYANKNIRCNAICPGSIKKEVGSDEWLQEFDESLRATAMRGMGWVERPGESEEIAEVAIFLASESSSYINGQAIVVDGGWTCY